MAEMADPDKLAAIFEKFSIEKEANPAVRQLHRRMQEGDEEASYELQQMVADEAWGGRTYMEWEELSSSLNIFRFIRHLPFTHSVVSLLAFHLPFLPPSLPHPHTISHRPQGLWRGRGDA